MVKVKYTHTKYSLTQAYYLFSQDDFHRIGTGPIWSSNCNVRPFVCCLLCVVPFLCDFFKVLRSKGFRCGMWIFINTNKEWREKPPLFIIICYCCFYLFINSNYIRRGAEPWLQ